MNVVVNVDQRFERTPDGAVWTYTQFPYAFWLRYLDVFEGVRVVARARNVRHVGPLAQHVNGPGVEFFALPYFHGMKQYLRVFRQVRRAVGQAVRPSDALILRIGSPIGGWLEQASRPGQPYAAEVVSDPWDVFSPGAFPHPLRPLFRRYYARQLRGLCRRAAATAYVTQQALQRRYPGGSGRFSTHYSSVDLGATAFGDGPRRFSLPPRPIRLITVGGLSTMYKGVDTLIEACAACLRNRVELVLTIVGEGQYQQRLKDHAASQGCRDQVRFAGALPAGDAVRAALDESDVFVLASRQEGLPRAMIEAMARGLPCLGTNVGGIPELIPDEDRFDRDDAPALAARISAVATDANRLNRMAQRNWEQAAAYREDVLRQRRVEFYQVVRNATEQWCGPQRKEPSQEPTSGHLPVVVGLADCKEK